MATETETAASYHTSTTETFEKKVDENEGKHDKAEEAPGEATPSSKTEGEAEGYDKKKAEHAVVEAEKSEDSPSLEATPEDNLEHDKVEDAQGTTDTEGEEKPPAVVVVEKIDGSMSSEASVADNLKGEKELIPDSHTISVTDAAKSHPEEPPPPESTETDEEKQPKTANIPEASSAETIKELSNTAEANPLTKSEVEVVKETEHLETSFQKIDKPDHAVTEGQEKSEEPENESQDKAQDAEQPNTVAVSNPSAETNEKPGDAMVSPETLVQEVHEKSEEKTQEVEQPNNVAFPDSSGETSEILSDAIGNREPVVPEVHKNSEEQRNKSQEKPQESEQPDTVAVSDPLDETNEKLGDATDKHDSKVAEVQKKSEELEKESQEKPQEAEQPKIIEVSDPLAETNEKISDAKIEPIVPEIHEKTEETEKESKENSQEFEQPKTSVVSDLSAETNEKLINVIEKVEPIVAEVHEKSEETEEESMEKPQEAEHPKTSVVSHPSAETNENLSDVTEKTEPTVTEVHEKSEETEEESQENPQEAEQPNTIAVSDSSVETNEKLSDATKKTEPIVTDIHEKSEEKEKESQEKPQEAEQPKTIAIPDPLVETSEKLSDVMEEKTRDPKCDDELSKVTGNYEAVPTETEEAEHLITEIKENPSEPEKQSFEKEKEEQLKTVIHPTESENAEKQGNIVEVHPPQKSDIEAVKDSGSSNLEAVSMNIEKPELVSTDVEEKHREQLQAAEIVHDATMSKETADHTVKEATSLQVEKTDKTEGTSTRGSGEQVSLNEEVKTDLKKGTECSAPISIEEKVAANDDNGSSRETEVEIKKAEEQNETMTGDVKAESVKDDRAAVDEEKQGHPETKEEIKETLASKLEEKEEESIKTGVDNQEKVPTKESDATKTPKETPVKPTQKQANNIIAKVKQTLLKAKKAITGKSPTTSKTISSQAKGDIQVK